MSTRVINAANVLSAITVCLLSACTSITAVKDVTADKTGHLVKNFSPQTLAPAVSKKIPAEGKDAKFGKLIITTEATSELSDGKKEAWKSVMTLVDNGNGIIQTMNELSNNEIPYALIYSLTYKGLVDLRWQTVPLRGAVTGPVYELKDATRFDALPAGINKDFAVNYTSGSDIQIANFLSSQKTCTTKRVVAASEFHKSLPGQATEIECQQSNNNTVQSRSKWLLLQNYGVVVMIENTSSARKTTYRLVDVN